MGRHSSYDRTDGRTAGHQGVPTLMKETFIMDERQFTILTETIREGLEDIKKAIVALKKDE
jgi:hypothetical protein